MPWHVIRKMRNARHGSWDPGFFLWFMGLTMLVLSVVYLFSIASYIALASGWFPTKYIICIIGTVMMIAGLFAMTADTKPMIKLFRGHCPRKAAFAITTAALTIAVFSYLAAFLSGVGSFALVGVVWATSSAILTHLASGWGVVPTVNVDEEVLRKMNEGD